MIDRNRAEEEKVDFLTMYEQQYQKEKAMKEVFFENMNQEEDDIDSK